MSCPDCFSGVVHEGEPRGYNSVVYGLDTYIAEPTGGRAVRGVLVVIPDAFGWGFANIRLLADHFADKGDYRVMVPDFMKGGSMPVWMLGTLRTLMNPGNIFAKAAAAFWTAVGFLPWMITQRPARSHPIVSSWFSELQYSGEARRDLPIFAAGYCWGGKHVVLLAGSTEGEGGRPLIDAGFTGHPSMLSVPDDIRRMRAPVSFAIPEKDHRVTAAVADEIEAVVRAKSEGSRGEVRIYPGCGHGFCVRADFTAQDVESQAVEAEDQALAWFKARLR